MCLFGVSGGPDNFLFWPQIFFLNGKFLGLHPLPLLFLINVSNMLYFFNLMQFSGEVHFKLML